MNAICGSLFKCTWLGSLSLLNPYGATLSYMIESMFFSPTRGPLVARFAMTLMAKRWMILALGSCVCVCVCFIVFSSPLVSHDLSKCFKTYLMCKEYLCESNCWPFDGRRVDTIRSELPACISRTFSFPTFCVMCSDAFTWHDNAHRMNDANPRFSFLISNPHESHHQSKVLKYKLVSIENTIPMWK